jgi:ABC-type transport system substrate-binding protein
MNPWRVAAAVASLAAFGVSPKAALGPRYGGEIVVGVVGSLQALPPRGPARIVSGVVDETLVRLDPEGHVAPGLAGKIEVSPDGRGLVLTLRPGVAFHDGSDVTAGDAAAAVRGFLRRPTEAAAALAASLEGGLDFRAGSTEDLAGIRRLDDRRLLLRLERARTEALAPLASPAAAVRSPSGAGCGPFTPLSPGARVGLRAFGAHFEGRPFLDRVVVAGFPTAEALRAAERGGRVDVALGEAAGQAAGLGSGRPPAARLLLMLDRTSPPFDAPAARGALDDALDRAAFAPLLPESEPARGLFVFETLDRGRREASSVLAGISGVVTLEVDEEAPPLASQRVVACLSSLGARVVVTARSAGSGTKAQARLLLFVPEVAETTLALRELAALSNAGESVRDALSAADEAGSPAERQRRLEQAEAALLAERACLPLARVPFAARARAGVHGLRFDAAGRALLAEAWLEP